MFVADVKCSQATWQSLCLRSCGAYVALHTRYQTKTKGIVGCLRRRDGYHQPGM